MEENQEIKQSRNSLGKGHFEFITSNGEKVEIKKVDHIREMRWYQYGDEPKDYEEWSVVPDARYECYDVTITKDGLTTTKRCYLERGHDRYNIEDAMKSEEFAQTIEEFFAPERIEEREQEAIEYNSTYLYMGGIERDRNGEWYRFRTFPDKTNQLHYIYKDIRDDEKKEADYIASHADPRARAVTRKNFTQEEIKKAQIRLYELKETDLMAEISLLNAELESIQSKLTELRKSNETDIDISVEKAVDFSDNISEAEAQIRNDLSRGKTENDLEEKDDENR